MMNHTEQSTDPLRHAGRYLGLVQALEHAHRQIRMMEQSGDWHIETLVARLLPHIADALDAEHTFLAKEVVSAKGRRWLELIATHPQVNLNGRRIKVAGRLHSLLEERRSRVIETLGDARPSPIIELKHFDATSAILTCLHTDDSTYVVGVCNRRNATFGPFLAPDRKTLEHILDLVLSALRTGARRKLELESIQRISERVTTGDLRDVYQQIVHEAVAVTQTLYAAIWQVNKNEARLDFVAAQHATEPTWQPREPSLLLDPWSLNGFVALSQAPHYVTDVAGEVHYRAWDDATTAAFCVPLVYRNHVLGTLYVASAAAEGINPEDRRFISQLAPHAAIALHNARMNHIHQLVIAFQQNTANILPLEEELEQIYEELAKHVDANGLFIARIDENEGLTFPLAYHRGRRVEEGKKKPGHRYGPQQLGRVRGMVEWVVRECRPLLVRDFGATPVAAEIDEPARRDVTSCVVLPIISAGRTIGAIGLRSYDLGLRFDDYDLYFLEALASYLAVVIENSDSFDRTLAQLRHSYEESRRRVEELQAVSRFQQEISTLAKSEGQEIENIHRHATDALRAVQIDTSNMLIVRYHKGRPGETGWLEFPLVYERGRLLTPDEKEADPAYRLRRLGERHDIIDRVIHHQEAYLGRTRAEIESWAGGVEGVTVAPQRSHSWLGAPMIAGGELLGLLALRDFEREHAFHKRHLDLAKTIASQAATAIQNARLYENIGRQVKELNALYAAGKAIAAAGLDRDRVLQTILEQAVIVTGAHFGTLQLKKDDYLEFVAAWPLSEREHLQEKYGLMPIDGKGVTARVARNNHYYLATDVTREEDYEQGSDETRSELAVSLRRGGKEDGPCEGVLNVEHRMVGGLGQQHVQPLINLSNLAVVAIQNASRAEQLTRSNAVAVMGAWGADLQHDANTVVNHLRLAVEVLRDLPDLPPAAQKQIDLIDQFAAEMSMPGLPEQPPEPGKPVELRTAPRLDEVLRTQLAVYRRQQPHIEFVEELAAAELHVAIHEAWLRRIVRHFLNNAAKFIPSSQSHPRITVKTCREGMMAAIYVTDNGKGVRPNIRDQLFLQPIDHEERRSPDRRGYGLWLVGYVIELYGGHCQLVWSELGQGSTFAIRLPVAEEAI